MATVQPLLNPPSNPRKLISLGMVVIFSPSKPLHTRQRFNFASPSSLCLTVPHAHSQLLSFFNFSSPGTFPLGPWGHSFSIPPDPPPSSPFFYPCPPVPPRGNVVLSTFPFPPLHQGGKKRPRVCGFFLCFLPPLFITL